MTTIITIFIFLLVMGLSINTLKAAENYNSSKSNTVTSIAKVHEYVGNILLPYGVGGLEINRVNDALDVGITADTLKVMLSEILGNTGSGATSGAGVSDKVQAILLEFDKIGIGIDGAQAVSTGATGTKSAAPSATVQPGAGQIEKGVSTPDATGAVPSAFREEVKREEREREGLPSKQAKPAPATPDARDTSRAGFKEISGLDNETKISSFFDVFIELSVKSIQDLKAVESKEQREDIRKELQANRETLQEGVQTLRQNLRENAKTLRENFRENIKTTIGHVDHGKTGRIALAHGKGLRMVNRFRSAIVRFDHILGRLESRIEKIGIEIEAQARAKGKVKWTNPPENLVILIEEAKNTQALNKAKLVELEAKYESLLLGENPGGIAKEARAIAKELKSEIEKLHALFVIGGQTLILDIPDDFLPPYTQNIDTFGRSGQDLTKKIAQSFEFISQKTVNQIKIKARENHNPTDGITVSLQTDTNDRPSGSALSSALKSRQQLLSYGLDGSSFTQITFNLNNATSLSPNTKYWIVVARENEAPFDNNNYYELRNYADVYSDGEQLNYRTCNGIDTWVLAGLTCADVDLGGVIGGGTIGIGNVDLPGGGLVIGGGQVVEFDIDLELWTTINPIKYMRPVR